ncbi:hypothetical protein BaRGS_00031569 [Batillaria attramentaria]|uniref:Uncharacterized protein n=1 Tax=Batillaria attramentaria TaxID=370345 RepID=A0ABD0JQD6_9CAEN
MERGSLKTDPHLVSNHPRLTAPETRVLLTDHRTRQEYAIDRYSTGVYTQLDQSLAYSAWEERSTLTSLPVIASRTMVTHSFSCLNSHLATTGKKPNITPDNQPAGLIHLRHREASAGGVASGVP